MEQVADNLSSIITIQKCLLQLGFFVDYLFAVIWKNYGFLVISCTVRPQKKLRLRNKELAIWAMQIPEWYICVCIVYVCYVL